MMFGVPCGPRDYLCLNSQCLEIHLLMLWDLKAATPGSWEGEGGSGWGDPLSPACADSFFFFCVLFSFFLVLALELSTSCQPRLHTDLFLKDVIA